MARFDSGDFEPGREAAFERVLELSPGHLVAQEYLEQIRERQIGAPATPRPAPPPPRRGQATAAESAPAGGAAGARGTRELEREILVPPEPGERRGAPWRRSSAPGSPSPPSGAKRSGARFLLDRRRRARAAAGRRLAPAAQPRASLFPNSQRAAQPAAPAAVDPIARAKALHAEGKTAVAIAQLRRLPPQQPQYAEAQSLISQWEALVKPTKPVPTGRPPKAQPSARSSSRGAERACRGREVPRCDRWLDQAAAIAPLDAGEAAPQAAQAQEGLRAARRRAQAVPPTATSSSCSTSSGAGARRSRRNRDVQRLIVDSYYNLGILDLQRGDPAPRRTSSARR